MCRLLSGVSGGLRFSELTLLMTQKGACPHAVGWEQNSRGKFGPRMVDLASVMDPVRCASCACMPSFSVVCVICCCHAHVLYVSVVLSMRGMVVFAPRLSFQARHISYAAPEYAVCIDAIYGAVFLVMGVWYSVFPILCVSILPPS